jgi:hypothetical protein
MVPLHQWLNFQYPAKAAMQGRLTEFVKRGKFGVVVF